MKKKTIIRVHDVMRTEFDIIDRRSTIREALQSMKHKEARVMIVDKRDEDDEYGLVDYGAIARLVLGKDRSPDRVNVYEIMSKPMLTAAHYMDIRYCARMFERFRLHNAPVLKDTKVVGIISYKEMLHHWMAPDIADIEESAE